MHLTILIFMSRHLPPLNALRAFEAAARHLSFTKAADELNVTQAAVSHQIKTLEERLGMVLFQRLTRSLLLTEAGQQYFPPVLEALDIIANATDRLHRHDQTGALTLSTMDSFAANWLVPRLSRFRDIHPEIDVRISTNDESIDLLRANIDIGVRYGHGDWAGNRVDKLMSEKVFPVCSPDLLKRLESKGTPLLTANDLRHVTLLHDDMRVDWRMWLMASNATQVDDSRGISLEHSNLVIQAAIQGDGVALARSALSAWELQTGRLVKPFDLSLPATFAYYIVSPEAYAGRPKIKAFRDWLLAEAKDHNAAELKAEQNRSDLLKSVP